jgi:hypothetical protein
LAAFQKLRPHKSLYIHQWSLYWIQKKMSFPCVSSIFKKNES